MVFINISLLEGTNQVSDPDHCTEEATVVIITQFSTVSRVSLSAAMALITIRWTFA